MPQEAGPLDLSANSHEAAFGTTSSEINVFEPAVAVISFSPPSSRADGEGDDDDDDDDSDAADSPDDDADDDSGAGGSLVRELFGDSPPSTPARGGGSGADPAGDAEGNGGSDSGDTLIMGPAMGPLNRMTEQQLQDLADAVASRIESSDGDDSSEGSDGGSFAFVITAVDSDGTTRQHEIPFGP
jgi:hypothetical protein